MKIGIISDSHDNIWALEKALNMLEKEKIEVLLHCGDLCAPFIVIQLDDFAEKLNIPVHIIFGNIDDQHVTPKMAGESKHVKHHGQLAELEIDGCKIAMEHYPKLSEALALSGKYDLVIHGHTHEKREEQKGKTLLLNPGEIMGRKGERTFAIYDTKARKAKFFVVE